MNTASGGARRPGGLEQTFSIQPAGTAGSTRTAAKAARLSGERPDATLTVPAGSAGVSPASAVKKSRRASFACLVIRPLALVLVVAPLALSSATAATPAPWQPRAPFPSPRGARFIYQSPVAIGGQIFAVQHVVFAYDRALDAWQRFDSAIPTQRYHHATAAANGRIYVLAGSVRGEPREWVSTVEEFDPSARAWRTRAPMPGARRNAGAVTLDGRIYVLGGEGAQPTPMPIVRYDPIEDRWTTMRAATRVRQCWGAQAIDGKIYILGNPGLEEPPDVVLDIYDPIGDTITAGAALPRQRMAFATAAANGKLLVLGGSPGNNVPLGYTDLYDPATDSWAPGPDLREPKCWLGALTLDETLYVLGGIAGDFSKAAAGLYATDLATVVPSRPSFAESFDNGIRHNPLAACESVRAPATSGSPEGPPSPYALTTPAPEPVLFGGGAVKGSSPTFSPDGTTVFTHLYSGAERKHTIHVSHFRDGHWTPSEVAPFSGVYDEMEPAFSADGQRLIFAAHRPINGKTDAMRLWHVDRTEDGWSEPEPLPEPIFGTGGSCGAPSLARDGSLYFGSLDGHGWPWEIWYSRHEHGVYSEPVKLNDAINPDGRSWSHSIASDETFLIFAGVVDSQTPRSDSLGDIDLYVSFRENGEWQRGVNLGPTVNTKEAEVWPRISRNGRTLFFNRQGPSGRGIYQIDLEPLLAVLRSKHTRSHENGPGIVRVEWPPLLARLRDGALSASPGDERRATITDIPVEFWQLPTGSRIAYLRFPASNPNGAIPFVFLHGGPGGYAVATYASARAACERLAQRGFDVYLYDQVGSGFSNRLPDPTDYTLDRHVADLEAIRQQIGGERMILLGASHGATLAANYLAAHPGCVEKVIFVSPGALDPAEHRDEVYSYRTLQLSPCFLRWIRDTRGREVARRYQRFDALLRRDVRAAYKFAGDAEMDSLADAWTQERLLPKGVHDPSRLPAHGRAVSGMGWWVGEMTCWDEAHRAAGVRAKLASCAVPALILRGDADFLPAVFADEYAATFSRSKLVHIPNAGHLIDVDQPEAYRSAIKAFLFDENDSSHALH